MSITPVGGWDSPKKDPVEGRIVLRDEPEYRPPVLVVQSEKKSESSFSKAFFGCLGVICALWAVVFLTNFTDGFVKGFTNTWNSTWQKSTLSTEGPPIDVSAFALNAAYDANEPAADNRYAGRTLRVYGSVKSIDKDASDSTYVMLSDGDFLGVDATLNNTAANNAIALNLMRGQSVVVLCRSVHRFATIVTLRNCDFTDPDTSQPVSSKSQVVEDTAQKSTEYSDEAQKIYSSMDKEYREHPGPQSVFGNAATTQPDGKPHLLHAPSITYPPAALAAHVSGKVIVGMTVEADGLPSNLHIVKSVCPALDYAALQTAQQAKFEPARDVSTGSATESETTLTFNFSMD